MNRTSHIRLLLGGFLILIAGLTAGCSIAMEATRPDPVRLDKFDHGESRDTVVAKLGQPISTTTDADGASCDLYSLPLSGYGNWAKAGIAFGEFLADFSTLGIAEVVSTPTEAATRNKKTPVWFCYKNSMLVRVTPKRLEGEDLASSENSAVLPPTHVTTPVGAAQVPPTSLPATSGVTTTAPAPASTTPSDKTE